jgi:hypothetical protein
VEDPSSTPAAGEQHRVTESAEPGVDQERVDRGEIGEEQTEGRAAEAELDPPVARLLFDGKSHRPKQTDQSDCNDRLAAHAPPPR